MSAHEKLVADLWAEAHNGLYRKPEQSQPEQHDTFELWAAVRNLQDRLAVLTDRLNNQPAPQPAAPVITVTEREKAIFDAGRFAAGARDAAATQAAKQVVTAKDKK